MDVDTHGQGQNAVFQDSSSLKDMPEEILEIIRARNSPQFLDKLGLAALKPALTFRLFKIFESVFADTCSRWISKQSHQDSEIIEAFARILPLAPHLSTYMRKYLRATSPDLESPKINSLEGSSPLAKEIQPLQLQRALLAILRLLNFDKKDYASTISTTKVQQLFQHEDRAVRFLAIRIFCLLHAASDLKLEQMIGQYVGNEQAILGDFDGESLDYGFLGLFEKRRLNSLQDVRNVGKYISNSCFKRPEAFSPLVRLYTKTLLPRPNGPPIRHSGLILTSTTMKNMENLAKALLSPSPILLHGLAGSGKTSLVNDFARELGVDSNMVTLHLNEQTDAKMLIGMYATGSTPGSFTWRAGVLTTAVREGRWVFIEDFDRAPNEVISVILPLIERGELLIPSRGETIRAGPGFRLLASIRTSLSVSGHENPPTLHMLGARLWKRVPVQMPSQDEFREVVDATYPLLCQFIPGIISVYERVYALSQKPSFASKSRTSLGRPISTRDLLKWCRRLDMVLIATGSKTGKEPISEATAYEMFLEAVDCFASSLQTEEARRSVIYCIAEEMHIDPQRVEHFLVSHTPRYEENEGELTVGRVRLAKQGAGRRAKRLKKSRPFANTAHAKCLLEQVGVAVKMAEPVLLVGETGIGKTTVIQQLADSLGYKLTAVNLSQQSEVGDLLGGFKPVNIRTLAVPLKDEFEELFAVTGISATKNQKYVDQLGKSIAKSQWRRASKLWREAPKMFERILSELAKKEKSAEERPTAEQAPKRRKTESKLQSLLKLKPRWAKFSQDLDQFDVQLSGGSKGFAFTFVEGNIVKAARNGEWVLLDEINLASPDTLESIADLLQSGPGSTPSILLTETGEIERVRAHPNFRIFGAMNPATDVGKRDLPMGLRSRFTEIFVGSPDGNLDDLLCIIKAYLVGASSSDERVAYDVAKLYMNTKRLAAERRLVDGANQVPHFSLRTLTRVLSYVTSIAPSYGLRRALYEGYAMGFLTLLDKESENMLVPLINHHLLESHGNPQTLLSQTPKYPEDGKEYVRFMNKKRDRQYWILQGSEAPEEQPHYIITPFVERNMLNLVRASSTRRFPVLIQGPTSSGKTSMIEYLAKFSGNKFVRINNHEHTDLQEYLGAYVSTSDGELRFQEGLLVQALRQGHWIVLDELNLAPTDVLEALNRLLDDNRELLIPETQEIVRPHDNFMLFATQNPAGLYGGRKTLSRAFRNRFLELHFDDIPEDELDFILEKRSQKVAPSDCRRIVSVYKELSLLRQSNRLFEQKDSFATLRDLFRWALRDADNREQLAANGFMLLAERVRNPEERQAVLEIIERIMKVKINTNVLYDANQSPEINAYNATSNTQGVVWTRAMRRLYVLVAHALRNNEPVLLVGETGCGKTTVCQMLADAFGKELHIVNAHQNTETGDLIGAQRPIRNRAAILEQLRLDLVALLHGVNQNASNADIDDLVSAYQSLPEDDLAKVSDQVKLRVDANLVKSKALFEWSDGSLVQAMKEAQFFLLDEISLADDSVLERLNSVLEPHRTILLAEKGVEDSFVRAAEGFQFLATMNPGGDYGKRELSPALRNRFTEIWVPSLSEHEDVLQIVESKLNDSLKKFASSMVHFAEWFGQTYRSSASTSISIRDALAWVKFMNGSPSTDPYFSVLHGAAMVYIDTLGANPAALLAINPETIREERRKCLQTLGGFLQHNVSDIYYNPVHLTSDNNHIAIGTFTIAKEAGFDEDPGFAFGAPTTKLNAMRVSRALQVQKPILIEGSPGVGKTTLIAALARACGKALTRINLSEQTDLMDLFGSDVPVEGAEAGHFAWRDAPFLQAMQRGEWVLLDEMNLASQSVLEGLNACLDHRGEVYISELDQTFQRHPNFSVFAAQNPHHQGGGRKGLPSSFVNRFTVVYADVFKEEDLELICQHNFPDTSVTDLKTIIAFVSELEQDIVHKRKFGSQGGPWEFNLRDILRWLQLLASTAPFLGPRNPADYLNLIFRLRFRTPKDRQEVNNVFARVFGADAPFRHFFHNLSLNAYQVGMAYAPRDELTQRLQFPPVDPVNRLPEIEAVMICIQQNMPCILVGPSGCGKTSLIEHVAAACGKSLVVLPLNADTDTMDLVGGFEQVDPQRAASSFIEGLKDFISNRLLLSLPIEVPEDAIELLEQLEHVNQSPEYFTSLAFHLEALASKTSLPEFGSLARNCRTLAETSMTLENARFEWVDGVLVKALERGDWLVLDNANLCSASVLDRLNSLLEPNGFLSINEHCGSDGEPKIVKPHADSRIFLTMDPRFGEVSRAMRNRATEIFLEPFQLSNSSDSTIFLSSEPAMGRYDRALTTLETKTVGSYDGQLMFQVALDNLAWSDMPLLPRFAEAFHLQPQALRIIKRYLQIYRSSDYLKYRAALGDMWNKYAAKTGLSNSFRDAQIIHPLQNSPLAPLLQQSSSQLYWLASIFELQLSTIAALELLTEQEGILKVLKPSMMNRLQRSFISTRVSSVASDSTVGASNFLSKTIAILRDYLSNQIEADDWKLNKKSLTTSLRFWWETYYLLTSKHFDEATFQAHLAIGRKALSSLSGNAVVDCFQQYLQAELNSGFQLKTGLSMEILWKEFRPLTIPDLQTIENLREMEKLAARFDALKWNVSISVSELGAIMNSLVKAYRLFLTSKVDSGSLIKTLSAELGSLEANIGREEDIISPFFASQFEGLRQFQTLEAMRSERGQALVDLDTIILANHPTNSEMRLSSSSDKSRPFQLIDYLWGTGNGLQPIMDSFSVDLLKRLHGLGEVSLRNLRLLESELPTIGMKLTTSTGFICREQLSGLNRSLFELIVKVSAVHGGEDQEAYARQIRSKLADSVEYHDLKFDELSKMVEKQRRHALSSFNEDGEHQISAIVTTHFHPSMICITAANVQARDKLKFSALSWIYFAVGCLSLYVPDRAFDPDMRQKLERQKHIHRKESLESQFIALRQFENLLTKEESNLRCQLVEEELVQLGEPSEILQEIYRPEVSELDQLQGEFKNLLTTVVQSDIDEKILRYFCDQDRNGLQEIKLMQSNVHQIIRRLSERFQCYTDLTSPIVSMLRCFQIGLSMITPLSHMENPLFHHNLNTSPPLENQILNIANLSPFLGAGIEDYLDCSRSSIASHPMEYMSAISVIARIDGLDSLDSNHRRCLIHAIHGCYEQWAHRLELDKLEAEAKTGLYRFKGSAEDEDEEDQEQFNELFPSYEDGSLEPTRNKSSAQIARDTAVQLAKVHSGIFGHKGVPSTEILSLIRQISKKIGANYVDRMQLEGQNLTSSLLPGALLLLNDQVEALDPDTAVPDEYNFYTSAHLPETRKLVRLIHKVQTRFRELQAVDEIGHMQPLEDVVVSCRELLQFRHTEPLAKIITKLEKIHGFMHEWQFGGWASRTNSALTLYDTITSTIVNWRRLELSTWAKLFEMESKYCDDDARSWWFVAYQVVIGVPLSITESNTVEELKIYAQKLLKDLETYFSTSIIGQFKQRLRLLSQLQKNLELLVLEFPQMNIISAALTNFISIYGRYEKPVEEYIKKGRVSLDKSMRDVILLATWKDTNIVALRDSAKRSHHNLFKIVRKFRALLGQPMEIIMKQGLPDESAQDIPIIRYETKPQYPTVDLSALTVCAETVPRWSEKSKRFVNVSKTVSMMADTCLIPESALDATNYLGAFLTDITSSTTELQEATPSILTEDNKALVKHLKSRKRKLFSDTLKDLRKMGVKYNLGVNALSKQESLATVLASIQPLSPIKDFDTYSLEYYFQKSIDIAPRAREAARQHSEDLTVAEISRSSGFLEGLLQLLISRQNTLANAVGWMARLEQAVAISGALWSPKVYKIRNAKYISNDKRFLHWIPNILRVGIELLQTHSRLSKIESKPLEEQISFFINIFEGLSKQLDLNPGLPSRITSTAREELSKATKDSIAKLRSEIRSWGQQRPDLRFILDQMLLWISTSEKRVKDSAYSTVSELDQKLSLVCDSILVAIEKHQKANNEFPKSTEEPGWLIRNEETVANSIKSLHSDYIAEQLQQAFEILQNLDLKDDKTSRTASAIFAVAQPIIQQYYNILQRAVIRYAELHQISCKTFYLLAKTFTRIATQGFCTPSEQSKAQDGKTEKLEGGTGLGDGDGAEDISKDIQDDEDLDELAQEPNAGEKGEMEDEKDAVDMADGEMEGEMGDGEDNEENEDGSGDDDSGDDMDEEAGDVDDLDPTAVDEKMWDGDNENAEKDQEGDESKGKQQKDEQAAAQDDKNKPIAEGDADEEEPEEMEGAEQGEEVKHQDDVEKHDPHAQDSEILELPEDMELDGDGDEESTKGSDDDQMNEVSDVEEEAKCEEEINNDNKEAANDEDIDQQNPGSDMDIIDLDEENENAQDKTEDATDAENEAGSDSEEKQPDEQDNLLRDRDDETAADTDNAVPSDVQGVGEDQDENSAQDNKESSSKAQREDGGEHGESSEQKDAAAETGDKGRQINADAPPDGRDETEDSTAAQPFKKLGDALESWHRQQSQIRDAPESKENNQKQDEDINAESSEFQHLQDDEAEADTQALGTTTEEQAHTLDESMAVDSESKELPEQFQPNEEEQDKSNHDDLMDVEDSQASQEQQPSDAYEGRAGAMINEATGDCNEDVDESGVTAREDLEEEVEEVDNQLESTHLEPPTLYSLRSDADARQQWTHYEAITRDLSLSLTEQLRLILAPTLATKMRGDFRTGKRLNIKRIIPYIASQYKRDKIWMRRSVPSKRSYQVMLAVDDSKSMGESGSGSLAFETLVMVSKALSMLEVGEICVVGFGNDVKVAHDFDIPFSSDSGPKIFQNFGFDQSRTDVTKLIRESIGLFRAARQKASGNPQELWQMQLIISDGVCDSSEHEPIRRLLREAFEERIMMVFVIVDDVRNKKKGESVMDLKEAKFVKNEMTGISNVKIERYLDTFPFQYYLIVSDVKELPGVLATLLRQWFAEVVDSSR